MDEGNIITLFEKEKESHEIRFNKLLSTVRLFRILLFNYLKIANQLLRTYEICSVEYLELRRWIYLIEHSRDEIVKKIKTLSIDVSNIEKVLEEEVSLYNSLLDHINETFEKNFKEAIDEMHQ